MVELLTCISRPPPQSDIPQQVIVGQARVRWESYNFSPRTVPSPVNPNKNYNELNVLFANSIDFGAKDGKMSVVVMHTVHAPEKVQLKLDLARKELDIQFPLKLGDETRKFRFRLPIAHLSRIYKDANSVPGQTALIIPFESPPQFFVQKHEGEQLLSGRTYTSFSKSERKWSDWSTWFREIDVVDTGFKSTMQKLPLMDNKDIPVIDIGESISSR
jgi:RNA-dependent RNA polymerase